MSLGVFVNKGLVLTVCYAQALDPTKFEWMRYRQRNAELQWRRASIRSRHATSRAATLAAAPCPARRTGPRRVRETDRDLGRGLLDGLSIDALGPWLQTVQGLAPGPFPQPHPLKLSP
jgi:hypothetical protein